MSNKQKKKARDLKSTEIGDLIKDGAVVVSHKYVAAQPGEDYYLAVLADGRQVTLTPGDFGSLKKKGRVR